jgi:hypothetical protein
MAAIELAIRLETAIVEKLDKKDARTGGRTLGLEIKSLTLYRLSYPSATSSKA